MTSAAIDLAVYRELQDAAGAEFVAELVDTFLEQAPGMVAELRSASADADADRFRRAAHSLKSNSLTFGAMTLGALARELEVAGFGAAAGLDDARVDAIEAEYRGVAAELKALRHG
jgi:HPt (histidine-containing phosphotransfer) domain-containing protein